MKGYWKSVKDIRKLLTASPHGLSITEISAKISLNRNSVAKYLDILRTAGKIDVRTIGPAKVYFASQRIPLKTMLDFSSEYILVLDNKLNVLQINDRFLKLLNIHKDSIINKSLEYQDLFILDEKEVRSRIRYALDGNPSILEACYKRNKDKYCFKIKFLPAISEEGDNIATLIVEDTTPITSTLEKLKESEEKFKTIAEYSPNMIFINKRGKVVYVNKAAVDIMGYSKKEFYSDKFDFMSLVAPESRKVVVENLKVHGRGQDVDPYEYYLITKDKKKLHVILAAKLIPYEGEHAILGIVTDIMYKKLK